MGKGLSSDEIIRRVRHVAEPLAKSLGIALWGVECVAGGRPVVRVYVDALKGAKNRGEHIGESVLRNAEDVVDASQSVMCGSGGDKAVVESASADQEEDFGSQAEIDHGDFPEFLEGVSVDQCAHLSRLLGPAVDAEEIFADPWVLEVSSPGLDRLFFEPAQMFPYVNEEVDVVLTDPHPSISGRRKFKGVLLDVKENVVTMEVLIPPAEGEKPVPVSVGICWEWVRKARLVPVFPEKSKPKAGKSGKAETNR